MSTISSQVSTAASLSGTSSITPVSNDTSELQAKAGWLKKRLEIAIDNVGQKRTRNQRRASFIKILMITFSSVATILLGLQMSGFEPIFGNIAFVLTSTVTFLTAIEPFFNYRALWVEHEQAKWKFYRLKDELDFYLEGTKPENMSQDKLEDLHQRYQDIWNRLSSSWIDHRQSNRFSI